MGDIDILLLISRWVHLASAILAVGGAAFAFFALIPASRETLDAETDQRLRGNVVKRWAPFVHGATFLLLLTGFLNFYWLAIAPRVKPMPYHALFGIKLLLALFVFFIASALVSRSPGFASFRTNRAKWLKWLLGAAAVIVVISGILNQLRSKPGHYRDAQATPLSAAS